MNSAFDFAFKYLLENEGFKYVDDLKDSGGPTMFGITLKSYEAYMCAPVSEDDFRNITLAMAKTFYFKVFWSPMWCDKMRNPGTAVCIFDSGVLYGLNTAIKMAQKSVSILGATIKFDGLMGDTTLGFLNIVSQSDLLASYRGFVIDRINSVIAEDPKNERFRLGWMRRADRLLTLRDVASVMGKST